MIKQNEFFKIPREEVLARLSKGTVDFYRNADYLDLTGGDLHVFKDLIRSNEKIVDNIDRIEGKSILSKQGLQLPSVALMYTVIIRYLETRGLQDVKMKGYLESMADNSEFLEDIVMQPSHKRMARGERTFWEEMGKLPREQYALKLRIGNNETPITLPHEIKNGDVEFPDYEVDGSFGLEDLNAFGFPITLRENQKFRYWGPNDFNRPIAKELYSPGGSPQGEVATIRYKTLDLMLTFIPRSDIQDKLGIRGVYVA